MVALAPATRAFAGSVGMTIATVRASADLKSLETGKVTGLITDENQRLRVAPDETVASINTRLQTMNETLSLILTALNTANGHLATIATNTTPA